MKQVRRIAPYFLCFLLSLSIPAFATTEDELQQTQKRLEESKSKQAAIAGQTHRLESELDDLQKQLVAATRLVQEGEVRLSATEDKGRVFNDQWQAKNEALKNQRKMLDALVQAALRLSRTPPEAMVMMPGDVTQNMQAARALTMTSQAIKKETESLGLQLAELQKLKQKVARSRDDLSRQQTELDEGRQKLERKLAERKGLQAKLGKADKQEAETIAQLAKKADNLQGLVSTLTQEERHGKGSTWLKQDERSSGGKKGKLRSFADAKGSIRTPVAGQVVQQFGAQGRNETSKGLIIESRKGAEVTAPYDGEVVFTGPFLDYGQLVILRHSDEFHTLLAGLAKIDVDVGQFLLEGEPIGAMGDSAPSNRLYVELRKDNQPVDPAPWIHGLKK